MTSPESFSEQEQQFLKEFQQSLDLNHFERLILSQYQGKLEGLQKITFRLVEACIIIRLKMSQKTIL